MGEISNQQTDSGAGANDQPGKLNGEPGRELCGNMGHHFITLFSNHGPSQDTIGYKFIILCT